MCSVSIVTAAYNAQSFIEQTYNSIKSQTITDWEWLVTDDCSTDNTLRILSDIAAQDKRVKIFRNPQNSGAAVARNKSLQYARGTFIAFIDSDDLWLPNKLHKQIHFMGENIDFSFTAYELIDANGKQLNKHVDADQDGSFDYKDMLKKKATLGCSTVIVRRAGFDDISMPLLRTGQDYALWLKLLKTGKQAYVLNKVMGQYRILTNSISRNKFKKARRQWQIYRQIEALSIFQATVCFLFYAWRAVFRK
jgi:glycosyltransferase involved in cell wall biosynthesis